MQIQYKNEKYDVEQSLIDPLTSASSKHKQLFEFINLHSKIPPLSFNLGTKIHRLEQAVQNITVSANSSTKDTLIACLKTALLAAVVAAPLFSAFLFGAGWITLGCAAAALLVTYISHLSTSAKFVSASSPEKGESPIGSYLCPNPGTTLGKLALCTGVWPLIGGLFGPLREVCTRQRRWNQASTDRANQLDATISDALQYYKTHRKVLIKKIVEEKKIVQAEVVQGGDINSSKGQAQEQLLAELQFLCRFDETLQGFIHQLTDHELLETS